MKQIIMVIVLSATSILLCACPDEEQGHRYVTFTNKSGGKIGYQYSIGKIVDMNQDTMFRCNMVSDKFLSNDSSFILESRLRVEDFETELGNSHYIQFLIMDGRLFEQYFSAPCDTVRKYVPILYRYQLTLEDLQRMNWTVVYPPE